MKAPDFTYLRADRIEDVFDAFAEHGEDAQIIAGGQSLVASLNLRLSQPAVLVDINGLGELAGISADGDGVRIGALARHVAVAGSDAVATHLPLIARAMPHVAHMAVRNRGTFGGSLALADPAAEMPACLLALAGEVVLRGPGGERRVAADEFFQGLYETARAPDEILVEAHLPAAGDGEVFAFQEFSRRHGDFAQAGIACRARLDDGAIRDLRLVVFAVEERPRVIAAAAAAADGKSPMEAVDAVVDAVGDALDPMDSPLASAAYKRHLARVLAGRAIAGLAP